MRRQPLSIACREGDTPRRGGRSRVRTNGRFLANGTASRLMAASDNEKSRLDEAARAGWLYFIAGHTQDEIAKMLQVSRASAHRLVSLCLSQRVITFPLEQPIAAWMELGARLQHFFSLAYF